ncbi:hypothetical protein [Halobacillus andaensis]|uniref:hypothetical protein n=1 Tax=Halobacillus andaensis TaxID=1176239 RepID=UPI003D743574
MKKVSFFLSMLAGFLIFLSRPKKVLAPITQQHQGLYPGTEIEIEAGDLLFSPIGKSESKYVGHVGILDTNHKVTHSVPSGLIQDSVENYCKKFRSITIYAPRRAEHGLKAASYLKNLNNKFPKADYKVFSSLAYSEGKQYCTKIVWLSYKKGAGINLGSLPDYAKAVHPRFIRDLSFLYKKGAIN